MDDLENEEYINSHLYKTNYYNEYKILEDMGFNKLMIKKVYAYINPKSLEEAIQFMNKNNNNIYQHEFFPYKDNKCFYCEEEPKYYCSIVNGKYYGKDGSVVSQETYKKQCEPEPEISYLYQYKKVTEARFSAWTSWSSWAKTSCSTQEINCNEKSTNCLRKLQTTSRKEKIGEYDRKYIKTRNVLKQTGSYTQKACSKYNYVIVNNTTYATTTTTTYTVVNTITNTTRHTTGNWVYSGRGSYTNPPRDDANTSYKFVGADYSYCNETCTSLPNFYYDKYTYTGGMSSVTNTTSTPTWTSTTSTNTTSDSNVTVDASCGSYVTKTIPI